MVETEYERFLGSTVGRYTVFETGLVWCASRALCGVLLWGAPKMDETRRILHVLDQYPTQMASSFAIVLDTRAVEAVDASALALLYDWIVARREDLSRKLRLQANVIREGPIGFLLTGLLPVARWTLPYRVFYEPSEAFRAVTSADPDALCAEVEGIAERARGASRELAQVRRALAASLETSLDLLSRSLGISSRSLQRALHRAGTSFQREVASARLARAEAMLRTSDDKIATVGARVGLSERALTQLFRSRTGLTPGEWRKRARRAPTSS